MSSCAEIKDAIGTWLDGELSGVEAEAVRAHIEICPGCADERRRLEKIGLAMRGLFESEAQRFDAEPFWRDLRARLSKKRPWYIEWAERSGPVFRAPSFAWSIPVVIVLLLGALYFDVRLADWGWRSPGNNFTTVESIDAFGRNVALLREHETKTTVIWVYQNPESEDEAPGEADDKGPAF